MAFFFSFLSQPSTRPLAPSIFPRLAATRTRQAMPNSLTAIVRGFRIPMAVLDRFLTANDVYEFAGYAPFYDKLDNASKLLRGRVDSHSNGSSSNESNDSKTRVFIPYRMDQPAQRLPTSRTPGCLSTDSARSIPQRTFRVPHQKALLSCGTRSCGLLGGLRGPRQSRPDRPHHPCRTEMTS